MPSKPVTSPRRFFHATARSKSYFEGWYFKQSTASHTVALIPSFHRDKNGNASALLQVAADGVSFQVAYRADQFAADPNRLDVRIGDSRFTADGVSLLIDTKELSLKGSLHFGPPTALRSDIMGPFRHLPAMQCNHGVLSMKHTVDGMLLVNGARLLFDRADGYIETDWGRSFPRTYLWTQCNGLDSIAVMASVADIPIGPATFTGCICAILVGGQEVRIATYHGAHVETLSKDKLVLRQGGWVFIAECLAPRPVALRAPVAGEMRRIISESPACPVRYQLWKDGRPLFERIGNAAGFEYAATEDAAPR